MSIDNKKFFQEIVKGLSNEIKVLSVPFARDKNDWQERFLRDKDNFSSASPDKNFKFILADEDQDIFIKQIKDSDVIYLKGGNTHILRDYLAQIKELKELFSGKIIAGSSAGALALSEYYYENDDDTYNKGLGILPIKTFCHYSEEKNDKLKKLEEFGEDIESIYAIPEEKFFIITK